MGLGDVDREGSGWVIMVFKGGAVAWIKRNPRLSKILLHRLFTSTVVCGKKDIFLTAYSDGETHNWCHESFSYCFTWSRQCGLAQRVDCKAHVLYLYSTLRCTWLPLISNTLIFHLSSQQQNSEYQITTVRTKLLHFHPSVMH